MRKSLLRLFYLLTFFFVGVTLSYSQSMTVLNSLVFEEPVEDIITSGIAAIGGDCGIAFITLQLNDANYINSISLNVDDSYHRSLWIQVSNSPTFSTYTQLGYWVEPTGPITIPVNQFVSYIKIYSEETENPQCGFIYIDNFSVSASLKEIAFGYDAAGNRISRYILTTPKSATGESEAEPQDFTLDGNTNIRLYPNPTSGILNFEVINPETEENPEVKIKIYSVSGSLLKEEEFLTSSFTLDISNEQNGTYLLDMQVNGKKQHFTIIKQ